MVRVRIWPDLRATGSASVYSLSFVARGESFVRRERRIHSLENWPCSLEEILDSREGTEEDPFMPAHAGRSLYAPVGQVQVSRDYVPL